jgi:hypothetical protein
MNTLIKFLSFIAFPLLLCLSSQAQMMPQNQYQVAPLIQMQSHKFRGGSCYRVKKNFGPDMVTFTSTRPEFMSATNIQNCLSALSKEKFELVEFQVLEVDVLQEMRTENLACAQIGEVGFPLYFQVRFSDWTLTGKDEELVKCLSLTVKDKTPYSASSYKSVLL